MVKINSLAKLLMITLIAASLTVTAPFNIARGEEVIDSIAAIVNNDIILESEVHYGVSTILLEQGERFPTDEMVQETRARVLDAFITQKVLLARANEESLTVEDRVVDRELDRKLENLVNQVGGEDKLVEYFNKPLRMIRREMRQGVRESLLVEMLRQRHFADVHIRRSEVAEFYDRHRDELPELPERVEVSHILLEIAPSTEAEQSAWEKIREIETAIRAGADFDSLARARSDDTSAPKGGRLGFTNRGDLVPEYEEAAFALEPGQVSAPVRSRYGLHLIRLIERQGERISTQHILVRLTPTDADRKRITEFAQILIDSVRLGIPFGELARRHSDDINSAEKGGLLGILEMPNLPSDVAQAFEGLREGDLTGPIETPFGIQIFKLERRLPAKSLTLEDDWQSLEQMALNNKREKMFREWVEELKTENYIRQ